MFRQFLSNFITTLCALVCRTRCHKRASRRRNTKRARARATGRIRWSVSCDGARFCKLIIWRRDRDVRARARVRSARLFIATAAGRGKIFPRCYFGKTVIVNIPRATEWEFDWTKCALGATRRCISLPSTRGPGAARRGPEKDAYSAVNLTIGKQFSRRVRYARVREEAPGKMMIYHPNCHLCHRAN